MSVLRAPVPVKGMAGVLASFALGTAVVGLVLLALGRASAARADEGDIRVVSISATSELPDGVRFAVKAESSAPITDVIVRFSVSGRKASQYDYLDLPRPYTTEASAELLLRTDTPQRYIPPGSVVTYYFEIEDESGAVLETGPEELVLLDSRSDWDAVQAGPVTVYYVLSETRAEDIAEAAHQTLLKMGPILGAEIETPINVTMYNNYADMIGALVPSSTTISRELVTEGQAFSDESVLLVLGGGRRALGTASHELTHILVGRAVHGSPFGVATWLNEGLAEYGNVDPGISYDRFLEWAIDTERLAPLEQLERFPGDPNLVIVSYGQARAVVQFMVEAFGSEKMAALMALLGEGERLGDSLEVIYGLSIRELDNRWRESVSAPPLGEKPEAALPTPAAALPTLVPYSLTPVAGSDRLAAPTPAPAATAEPAATLEPAPSPDTSASSGGGGCSAARGPAAVDVSWLALLVGPAALSLMRRLRP